MVDWTMWQDTEGENKETKRPSLDGTLHVDVEMKNHHRSSGNGEMKQDPMAFPPHILHLPSVCRRI